MSSAVNKPAADMIEVMITDSLLAMRDLFVVELGP